MKEVAPCGSWGLTCTSVAVGASQTAGEHANSNLRGLQPVKPQNLLAEKLKRQPVRRRVALRRQRHLFCLPSVHYTQASRRQGHPPNLQASAKLNIAHLSWVCSKSNLKQFYNSFTWAGFALPVTMLSFTLLPISDCFDDRGRWPQCHSCIYSGFRRVGYDFTDIHLQL